MSSNLVRGPLTGTDSVYQFIPSFSWHVEHPLLKGYSIAILKLVDLIKDIVAKGSVYEEEDFQPLVYGFKLATEVSEMRTSGMLRELEVS